MKNPWNLSESELKEKKAIFTATETCQQPQAWLDTLDILAEKRAEIEAFVTPLLKKAKLQIIFTGAGTSDYVGDTIAPYLRNRLGKRVDAIATTDIVSSPAQYLEKDTPTVLVSFARSGNSPESVAAYDLAEQLVDEIYQIVITCNAEGTLAKRASKSEKGKADKWADECNTGAINMLNYAGMITHGAFFALVTFLPIYFGAASAEAIVQSVPQWILGGLGVAGGMMPAIGFAMLLKIMLKKQYITFLLAGFIIVTYFQISILGLAILGACIALYDFYANEGKDNGPKQIKREVRSGGI